LLLLLLLLQRGQLGHGDLLQRNTPTVVAGLQGQAVVAGGGPRQPAASSSSGNSSSSSSMAMFQQQQAGSWRLRLCAVAVQPTGHMYCC
jgi:hypothetical protein